MRWILIIVMAVLLMISPNWASNGDKIVLLHIKQPNLAWADSRIFEKLQDELTRDPLVRVLPAFDKKTTTFGSERVFPDTDSLINLGRDKGGQFLLYVLVRSERLEKRKSFHVPLVFHKWESIGVLEGELRIIDLLKGKLSASKPFLIELHGPRAIQATMDDTKNDPDLHMLATDKQQFFSDLEDKLIGQLIPSIKQFLTRQDGSLSMRMGKGKTP
jgi:hypothetical protein